MPSPLRTGTSPGTEPEHHDLVIKPIVRNGPGLLPVVCCFR